MDKTLIILIGPQGSGKTFYCQHTLQAVKPEKAAPDRIVRISQDDLGKQGHIETFLKCFDKGYSMVVDRINHLRDQRRRYTEAVRQHGYKIKYVWFDVDRQLCLSRMSKRIGHPTINRDDNHERILACYFRDFEKPEHYEYSEIEVVTKRKSANTLDLRETIGDNKFIVVGDIHGCFVEFTALLNKCGYTAGDFVISVGDLMDRGPKSREVIEWFRDAQNAYSTEGNHDNKARRYWAGRRVKVAHGLDKTIEQCKDMDTTALAQWIESWPQMIRLPDINGKPTYVVHAGVDGKIPMDRQPLENCLYARYFGGNGFLDESGDIWYSTLNGSYNIISGHMIHDNPIPTDYVFLLDGGAFQGGELRALVVDAEKVRDTSKLGYEARIRLHKLSRKYRIESVKSNNYSDDTQTGHLSVSARDELVEIGLLRCDDLGDLRIYNYTDECTHSAAWNDITMNSRGIIFNVVTGEVVAQPMPKFFNVGQSEDTMESKLPWNSDYLVFEKMDGWLGTLYRYEGKHCIATRGSFDGMGMAPWATEFLDKNYDLTGLPEDVTLVFEIICPQTHIIVHYGAREDLILLTAYNRHTGEEYKWDQVTAWANKFGFSLPRVFGSNVDECRRLLTEHSGTELEGFVIRFADGLRVKIKSKDYQRRAAIVSNLTPLAIWKAMRDNTLTADYRDAIDADYIDLFDELTAALQSQYNAIKVNIEAEYQAVCDAILKTGACVRGAGSSRKGFALQVQSMELQHRSSMFSMLDNKPIRNYIIKLIRPTFNELVSA